MALTSTRFVTGCAILFLVDILWTASSELTEHLYKQKHYSKPFFTAYVKSIMFTIYLFGFIFCDSWWSNSRRGSEYYSSIAENDQQNLTIDDEDEEEDDEEEENSNGNREEKNEAENGRKKMTSSDQIDQEEGESIQQTVNSNQEEFEEINLNQPNVIVNTAESDTNRTTELPVQFGSKSSKRPSNIRSPYIGEAIWLPIPRCSDTSSISGRSDEEDLHSDGNDEDDEGHLNETDDDKLLLIRSEHATDIISTVKDSDGAGVDEEHGDTLEVDILQPSTEVTKLPPKSAFASKQPAANIQNVKKHKRKRSVRFSKLMEVRHMTAKHAEDAFLSRLSYSAFMRHIYQKTHQLQNNSGGRILSRNMNYRAPSLNIKETALLAFYFTSIWFTANLSFHFGLQYSEAGLVNVLSSTTPLFTLLLGLIFPSGVSNDSVSVTKLLAVALFISSVAVISTTEPIEPPNSLNSSAFSSSLPFQQSPVTSQPQPSNFPIGSLWTLCGAFFYGFYVVLMRYNVLHDSMLNFPMFFGFIGLFSLILMWPFILLLDFTQLETFEWPNNEQWFYLLVNGLCGTVISELLFLLGSFLTSSLVGTIAVSFTIPMAVFFDMFFKDITYPGIFFLGTVPMMLSFFVIILLSQYSDWDPIMSCIHKFLRYFHTLPHHHSNNSTARYCNMDDGSSILQNLESNHSINSSNTVPDDSPISASNSAHSSSESKSPSLTNQNSNCNRRFERYTNKEDDEDGEQTQALINDQDNSL